MAGSDQKMCYTDIFPARYCSEEEGEIKLVQVSNDYLKILGIINHSSPYCGTKGDWADRVNSDLERYDQPHSSIPKRRKRGKREDNDNKNKGWRDYKT